MPKKGDTIRVTAKTAIRAWEPGEPGRRAPKMIEPGTVLVGEMCMNTRDGIKLKVGDHYFDFNRKDIKIQKGAEG